MLTESLPKKEVKQQPPKKQNKISLEESVKKQVLELLGRPKNLHKITARNLWDNRWRVNLWCTHIQQADVSEVEVHLIDYSYFIHTSDTGEIINSDPEIVKEY